jgi:hypothetical protein
VVELGRAPAASAKIIDPHRHREVGTLSGHHGTIPPVHPLAADLPEAVGPSLPGGARIIVPPRSCVGVQHGPKRREQRLAGLGVKVPVHPHHATERDRGMEVAALTLRVGTVGQSLGLHPLPPGRDHAPKVRHGMATGGFLEHGPGTRERPRVELVRPSEHANRGHRHVVGLHGGTDLRHRTEDAGDPHVVARRPPPHPMLGCEPRGRRQMSVALEETPALDLGEPAEPLGVEQLPRALQLGELLLDPSIRKVGHGLPPQIAEERLEYLTIEHVFDAARSAPLAL